MPGAGDLLTLAGIAAALLALLGLMFLAWGLRALWRRRVLHCCTRLLQSALCLAMAAALLLAALVVQGYQMLTREVVAAVVYTEPLGPRRFEARFRFGDGSEQIFELAGDELYVDAQIIKWKPWANLLGLHTAYSLDRVAGRYRALEDERAAPRTVHSLSEERALDLVALRRRYAWLGPVLDAEYGSASFVPADRPAALELRVSTTGLLIRPLQAGERGT